MLTLRKAVICVAAVALLAFVSHATIGGSSDDVRATSHAVSVNAAGGETASIPDFDGDGTVGFSDFLAFAGAFGSRQGDDDYQARFDLNGDGTIGFADFLIFAENFGKVAPSPVVTIPDEQLRAAIEAALGKASGATITRAEMKGLTELQANNEDISDLSGLEYATNLTWLNLSFNRSISDVSPLAGLTKLEHLDLQVLDSLRVLPSGAFARLHNLRTLLLSYTQIETLPADAFSGLKSLERLSIYSNRSLTPLPAGVFDGLTNLLILSLDNNRLASLPVGLFSDLVNLRRLWIRGNELTSLPAGLLDGLVNLQQLRLTSNLLSELPAGVFSDLKSLKELSLGNNQLSELPDGLFIGLNNLKSLDLTWNPGAPFPLNVEVKRTDTSRALAPGPAEIEVGLAPGTPFDVDVSLMVHNGTASSASLTIEAGSAASATARATAAVGASGATVINLGPMPRVPGGFTGIDLRAGAPLVLFKESDNRQPADRKTIPFHVLQVGGQRPVLDLGDYYSDEDGDELSYSVSSNDTSIVQARVDDGRVTMIPTRAGEVSIGVTATDPEGFSVSQRMFVTVLAAPDPRSFDIDLVFGSPVSGETRLAAQNWVERWTRVIRGDLPDVPLSGDFVDCGSWVEGYQFFGAVDDLVVFFEVGAIRGGTGLARTCGLRDGSLLPYTAHVFLDAEAAASVVAGQTIGHELGHALGFGSVWDKRGFLKGRGGDDPHFNGPLAIRAFNAAGGANYTRGKVPVSWDLGHWNGDVFGWGDPRELMMEGGGTVLSAITVQSFADLGYVVDVSQADPFRLPQAGQAAAGATARLHLKRQPLVP